MKVELLEIDRADELWTLWQSCYQANTQFLTSWTQNQIKDLIQKAGVLAVSDAKGLVAALLFSQVLDEAEIFQIFVAESHQRRGLASILVDSMIKRYAPNKIYLEVHQANSRAQSFYQSLGFEKIGLRKKYYSQKYDAHVYCLHTKADLG